SGKKRAARPAREKQPVAVLFPPAAPRGQGPTLCARSAPLEIRCTHAHAALSRHRRGSRPCASARLPHFAERANPAPSNKERRRLWHPIHGHAQNPGGTACGEIRQHQYGPRPAMPWRTLHPLELPHGNAPALLAAGRDETSRRHRRPVPLASATDPGELFLRPAQPHQLRRASAGYEPGQLGLRQATETFPPEADRKRRKHGNPLGQIPLSRWPKTRQEWERLQQAAALAPPPALPREEEQ